MGEAKVLNKEIRDGISEKVSFQPRLKEGEGAKYIPSRGSTQSKGPEAGACPACQRNIKEASVVGAEVRGRVEEMKPGR